MYLPRVLESTACRSYAHIVLHDHWRHKAVIEQSKLSELIGGALRETLYTTEVVVQAQVQTGGCEVFWNHVDLNHIRQSRIRKQY